MSIKLPASLGLAVSQRIAVIAMAAPRAPDGTLTEEGSKYIWREVTAEFGPDVANTIFGSKAIELHYDQPPWKKP